MEAKDTVIKITRENIRTYCGIDRYEVGDVNNPITVKQDDWDIKSLLKDQAEISFEAGRREVVEWVEQHLIYIALEYDGMPVLHLQTNGKKSAEKWQKQKKEWGL